jgi:hypothetical protein
MQKISSTSELKNAILQLEIKQELQGIELKEKFYLAYESFKSINLVKKVLLEMVTSPGLMSGIVKTVMQLVNLRSEKQTFEESTGSIIKNLLNAAIKFGLTNLVVQHSDTIKLFGRYIYRRLFHKKVKKPKESKKDI